MVVAPTGVIYQVGTYNYGQETGVGYLMVYAADGRKAYQSPAGGLDIFASDVTIAADNKPVIVGTGLRGSGSTKQTYIAVNRFLPVDPNAPVFTPDTTWGGTGLVAVAYNGPSAQDNASVGDLGFARPRAAQRQRRRRRHEREPGHEPGQHVQRHPPGRRRVAGRQRGHRHRHHVLRPELRTAPAPPTTRACPGFGAFLDANNNGTFDAGEVRVFSDASGRYTFNGLTPATYHVGQILPAGYTHTTPGSAVTASRTATVVANQTLINQDFGVTGTNSITGTFFTDANGNGTKDSGEAGISGGIVFLDLNGDPAADVGRHVGRHRRQRHVHVHPPDAQHVPRAGRDRVRSQPDHAGHVPAHGHAHGRPAGERLLHRPDLIELASHQRKPDEPRTGVRGSFVSARRSCRGGRRMTPQPEFRPGSGPVS